MDCTRLSLKVFLGCCCCLHPRKIHSLSLCCVCVSACIFALTCWAVDVTLLTKTRCNFVPCLWVRLDKRRKVSSEPSSVFIHKLWTLEIVVVFSSQGQGFYYQFMINEISSSFEEEITMPNRLHMVLGPHFANLNWMLPLLAAHPQVFSLFQNFRISPLWD